MENGNRKSNFFPQLDDILQVMPSGLFALDQHCRVCLWNQAMEELTGYSADEVMGQECSFLRCQKQEGADESFSPKAACDLMAQGRKGRLHQVECALRSRAGESVPVLRNARVITEASGQVVGLIETVTDLRPLKNLENELSRWRREEQRHERRGKLVGRSVKMNEVFDRIDLAAESDATVLITGPTGTGKELVAEAIHLQSARSKGPFVRVNCSALSENLLESELFGHVKGAFTGAVTERQGRFEAAQGGTILLDEIGDLSPHIQLKLLRVLQEKTIERVGDTKPVDVDVRVLAATHRDLRELVQKETYRQDFYYRIKVFSIDVAPLMDRPDDIPLLCNTFIERFNNQTGKAIQGVTDEVMHLFMRYCWPGNVRELEHAIEHAFVTCRGSMIELNDLPLEITQPKLRMIECQSKQEKTGGEDMTPEALRDILQQCRWNKAEAARRIGVDRTTVWRWMKQWKIPMKPQG